jgi:hypothetical protein
LGQQPLGRREDASVETTLESSFNVQLETHEFSLPRLGIGRLKSRIRMVGTLALYEQERLC